MAHDRFDLVSFLFNRNERTRAFTHTTEASAVTNATAIVAVTEAARREIRARYPQDNFLVMEGVPREDIVAEWQSTTTRENGIETARLIQGMPGKKVLLTSDFHMYRALRVFRKLGIDVTPMPIPDVLKASEHWNGRISGFQTMTAETAKIIYYKLHGWI